MNDMTNGDDGSVSVQTSYEKSHCYLAKENQTCSKDIHFDGG